MTKQEGKMFWKHCWKWKLAFF